MTFDLAVNRIYEPPSPADGQRVLVDRIWPRGVRKADAALTLWLKDIAPSDELRQWFGHEPARWADSGSGIASSWMGMARRSGSCARCWTMGG